MIASGTIISCNFTPPPFKSRSYPATSLSSSSSICFKSTHITRASKVSSLHLEHNKGQLQTCHNSYNTQTPQEPSLDSDENEIRRDESSDGGEDGGGGGWDWTTSFLLFAFWAGLMFYVTVLSPNQTPVTDKYFLEKLLNLRGDDGFEMNQVIVALWYIMGLWPLVYSMLLLPTARSSKSKIPVWPFLALSFFAGAYGLIPYFILWRPPAPRVEESELKRWPLNFLESKLTAGITMSAGLAITVYAISSGGDVWREFSQYFRGSRFIHVTSIDFALLSTFAPFWVYNDMTARKRDGNVSWLLPLSVIPFVGPALYVLLRPPLHADSIALVPESDEK